MALSKQAVENSRIMRNKGLVKFGESYYVIVSHSELDELIGQLMQMYELNGDREQREALKWETKNRLRTWLDNRYKALGYDNFTGVADDVEPTVIEVPKVKDDYGQPIVK